MLPADALPSVVAGVLYEPAPAPFNAGGVLHLGMAIWHRLVLQWPAGDAAGLATGGMRGTRSDPFLRGSAEPAVSITPTHVPSRKIA